MKLVKYIRPLSPTIEMTASMFSALIFLTVHPTCPLLQPYHLVDGADIKWIDPG